MERHLEEMEVPDANTYAKVMIEQTAVCAEEDNGSAHDISRVVLPWYWYLSIPWDGTHQRLNARPNIVCIDVASNDPSDFNFPTASNGSFHCENDCAPV
ncbi:hypothetical protein Ancab_036396 [Ancistrocladus abbreviatus]